MHWKRLGERGGERKQALQREGSAAGESGVVGLLQRDDEAVVLVELLVHVVVHAVADDAVLL